MIDLAFWSGKKVLVTGHTGFKGAWLCLWLQSMGAHVVGYALRPPTEPNLFTLGRVESGMKSFVGDIRDKDLLLAVVAEEAPDVVFHMAAQPLVRDSYANPVETYEINVMGTVYVLEAIRRLNAASGKAMAVVNVTSDKCYENDERLRGYSEHEPLGGYDPYSNSKACSELVTASYRHSYFPSRRFSSHGVGVASARAGNVIGGGDWAKDRLVPDCIRAYLDGTTVSIRNPEAVRPWQHVLEPLGGYLLLAQKLHTEGSAYAEAWNFGPHERDCKPVKDVVETLREQGLHSLSYRFDEGEHPHEAGMLALDCTKAKGRLGWKPRWDLAAALEKTVEWAKACERGEDVREVCLQQIRDYVSRPAESEEKGKR